MRELKKYSPFLMLLGISLSWQQAYAHDPAIDLLPVYSFCYEESEGAYTAPKFIPLSRLVIRSNIVAAPKNIKIVSVPIEKDRTTKAAKYIRGAQWEYLPAKFDWVDGIVSGSSVVLIHQPASYGYVTLPETKYLGEHLESFEGLIPRKCARYVEVMALHVIIKMPAGTMERIVPNIHKNGRTYMMVEPRRMVPGKNIEEVYTSKSHPFEVHDDSGKVLSTHETLQDLRKKYEIRLVESLKP